MSDKMWFQHVINDPQGFEGFWMCPTPNCGGAGFTFDIFPTDPDHPANEGWVSDDEEEGEWVEEMDDDEPEEEYDPAESKYQELDEAFGDHDDDIEGEEWKHGLEPGEAPPESPAAAEARREREEEQKKYDMPDERPRVLDWSDRTDRVDRRGPPGEQQFKDDDIPF
jgi:hypothetical protein